MFIIPELNQSGLHFHPIKCGTELLNSNPILDQGFKLDAVLFLKPVETCFAFLLKKSLMATVSVRYGVLMKRAMNGGHCTVLQTTCALTAR